MSVLFIDVVNFTGFTERSDPERVRLMQTAFFGTVREVVVERYGGVVEKYIGDAVMALFGAPVTTETDTVRCVHAALELQRELGRQVREQDVPSEFRIGIATGEALVDTSAARDGGQAIAAGDVINTASRLQSAATPGGVLVDDTTRQVSRRAIRYQSREPIMLRGHTEPTRVWVPEGPTDGPTERDQHDTALVNRTHELGLLIGALERTATERVPQLVTLFGRAGIGKSRLVRELARRAAERSDRPVGWRVGHCPPFGENVTYAAFAEVVKAEAGILDTDDADTTRTRLHDAIAALVSEPEAARLAGALGPLVGLPGEQTLAEDLESAWRRFVVALAERRTTVLVIEDLHWADQTMVDFVERLGTSIRDVPLMVLCTSRPELLDREPAWAGAIMGSQTITLGPLTDDHVGQMLTTMAGGSPMSEDVLTQLVPLAGGNPLYAHEYYRMLLEQGGLGGPASDGADIALDGHPMPDNVLAVIANRLDLLDPEERAVLQAGAVVGMQFWPAAVAAILDLSVTGVERRLRRLERRDLVTEHATSSMAGHAEYRFQHVLVRDVCYQRMPRTDRVIRHGRAADWLEGTAGDRAIDHAETLANHRYSAHEIARTLGVDTAPYAPAARRALHKAARRAYGLHALGVAAGHVQRALKLFGDSDDLDTADRLELLELELLDAELALLRDADAFGTDGAERLSRLSADLLAAGATASAAHALTLRAQCAWFGADHDTALDSLRQAIRHFADQPDSERKATAHAELARLHMLSEDHKEAVQAADEAMAMADRLGLVEVHANARITAGVSRFFLGEDAGITLLRETLAECRRLKLPSIRRAMRNLANVLSEDGDLAGSQPLMWEQQAQVTSDGHSLVLDTSLDSMQAYMDGDWDKMLAAADVRDLAWDLQLWSQSAWIRVLRDEPVPADEERGDDIDAGLRYAAESGFTRLLWTALGHAALCRALQGRRGDAERLLDELIDSRRGSRELPSGEWLPPAGHTAALLGGEPARRLLAMMEASPRQTRWVRAARLSAEAGLAASAGDHGTAADRLTEAAEVYRSVPCPSEEAIVLARAVRSYRTAGRVADADRAEQPLREFAARNKATRLLDPTWPGLNGPDGAAPARHPDAVRRGGR